MPLHIAGIAKWLLTQAGLAVFGFMQRKLLENVGLQSPPVTRQTVETLLDRQLHQFEERITQRVTERMDEDRLVTLRSGVYQLNMAAKLSGMTPLKQAQLTNALNKFADTASLPEKRSTAGIPNEQLCCLSHLGIAAIYTEMKEPLAGIADNIAAAIYADQTTARRWFGNDVIDRLLTICPKCGFENKPGDRFCPRDGQPLPASVHPIPASKGGTAASAKPPSALIAYCTKGHSVMPGTSSCPTCGEHIIVIYQYCIHGHANLPGASRCGKCGEALDASP